MGDEGFEPPRNSGGKQGVAEKEAQNPAHLPPKTDFAAAVAAIMALPLTDAEKAECVRRLLAGQQAAK
ncbi:MAG: hypothetical protein ABSH20_14915 [Tepidisphaeraceae bacterium]|jgi:hypothetical protein